jgi:hypothetical protein
MPEESSLAAGGSSADSDALPTIQRAVREVRHEGRKAAFVYAAADATLALLATNLLSTVLAVSVFGSVTVPFPVGAGGTLTLTGPFLTGLVVGMAVFAGEWWLRTRRPLVEQFERANPGVREALRTARDAAADGVDTRMARQLYGDVLDGLSRSSSLELLDTRRLGATAVLVVLLSLASVQVAATGVDVDIDVDFGDVSTGGQATPEGEPRAPPPDTTGGGASYGGLQGGAGVLGDPEDVTSGSVDLTADLATGGGDGEGQGRTYDRSGLSGDGTAVEAERAGFDAPPEFEDAALIRDYNLEIREAEDE